MKSVKKRLRSKGGFTLVELLVTIAILSLLVVAMGTGMSTALRVYQESIFQSNSESLASMLNATLMDLLQYSNDIYIFESQDTNSVTFKQGDSKTLTVIGAPTDVKFLFSNTEYEAQNAYIFLNTGTSGSPVQFKNAQSGMAQDLLNTGAYPDLKIENLKIEYENGLFKISYDIVSTEDASERLSVTDSVSLLNP